MDKYGEEDSIWAEEQPDFDVDAEIKREEEQTQDLKEIKETEIEKCADELMLVFKLNIKLAKTVIKEILDKYIK